MGDFGGGFQGGPFLFLPAEWEFTGVKLGFFFFFFFFLVGFRKAFSGPGRGRVIFACGLLELLLEGSSNSNAFDFLSIHLVTILT